MLDWPSSSAAWDHELNLHWHSSIVLSFDLTFLLVRQDTVCLFDTLGDRRDALLLHQCCDLSVPVLVVCLVVHELLIRLLNHSEQGELELFKCLEAVPVYCCSESFKADILLRHLLIRFRC